MTFSSAHTRLDQTGYMARKRNELALIESALPRPPKPPRTRALPVLLARKFKSAALCRAFMAAEQWSQTETGWFSNKAVSGAFRFSYEYQRADLRVDGPPVYEHCGLQVFRTQYAMSGMAALSAVLLAVRQLWPNCTVEARADGYPETSELIARLELDRAAARPRIIIVDSTVDTPRTALKRCTGAAAVIFDTSCFAASSGRIGAIARAVTEPGLPLILVRSHTKLDCFGLDYGRLGSVVVVNGGETSHVLNLSIGEFIRLTGSAALPLHFPPFAKGERFQQLTRERTASIMRATRTIERRLMDRGHSVRRFAHGLYFACFPPHAANQNAAGEAAQRLASCLVEDRVPARHAGSFGFDFMTADWFEDPVSAQFGVRIACGDLPAAKVGAAAQVIINWLEARESNPRHHHAQRKGAICQRRVGERKIPAAG
jgi:hypothetical protein